MQIIFKSGTYHGSELTEEQFEIARKYLWGGMCRNDILEITSGFFAELDDGTYMQFGSNLSYLEYLYDKRTR